MIYIRRENDVIRNGLNITITQQAWYLYFFLKIRISRIGWTRVKALVQKPYRKMWSWYRKLFR